MALKFFRIPVEGSAAIEADLNAVLSGRKVLRVARELVQRESEPAWAVCVEYLEGSVASGADKSPPARKSKVDYRDVLSTEDFAVFSKLRDVRKQLAENEGVPVYAIFSNEQLAQIAKARPHSANALGQIAGIGEAKVSKFAEAILPLTEPVSSAEPLNSPS